MKFINIPMCLIHEHNNEMKCLNNTSCQQQKKKSKRRLRRLTIPPILPPITPRIYTFIIVVKLKLKEIKKCRRIILIL